MGGDYLDANAVTRHNHSIFWAPWRRAGSSSCSYGCPSTSFPHAVTTFEGGLRCLSLESHPADSRLEAMNSTVDFFFFSSFRKTVSWEKCSDKHWLHWSSGLMRPPVTRLCSLHFDEISRGSCQPYQPLTNFPAFFCHSSSPLPRLWLDRSTSSNHQRFPLAPYHSLSLGASSGSRVSHLAWAKTGPTSQSS